MELAKLLEKQEIERAVVALETFFGTPFPETTVHLLMSRGGGTTGAANEGPGHVTLEILETEDLRRGVDAFLHEVAHLMENAGSRGMYNEFAASRHLSDIRGPNGWDAYHLLNEAITGSLLPGGCISRHLGLGVTDWKSYALKQRSSGAPDRADLAELTAVCLPLVERYVAEGRMADLELLTAAYKFFAGRDWESLKGGEEERS